MKYCVTVTVSIPLPLLLLGPSELRKMYWILSPRRKVQCVAPTVVVLGVDVLDCTWRVSWRARAHLGERLSQEEAASK